MASGASVRALSDHGVRVDAIDAGPILSYHASCLWRADTSTLLPGNWLNDNVIVWWEEHLTHEEFASRRELCFLHPGAVFLCNFETVDECVQAGCARCAARPSRLACARAHARARALTHSCAHSL